MAEAERQPPEGTPCCPGEPTTVPQQQPTPPASENGRQEGEGESRGSPLSSHYAPVACIPSLGRAPEQRQHRHRSKRRKRDEPGNALPHDDVQTNASSRPNSWLPVEQLHEVQELNEAGGDGASEHASDPEDADDDDSLLLPYAYPLPPDLVMYEQPEGDGPALSDALGVSDVEELAGLEDEDVYDVDATHDEDEEAGAPDAHPEELEEALATFIMHSFLPPSGQEGEEGTEEEGDAELDDDDDDLSDAATIRSGRSATSTASTAISSPLPVDKEEFLYSEAEKRANDCLSLALQGQFLTKYLVSHILGFGCNGVVVSAAIIGAPPDAKSVAIKIIYKQSETRYLQHSGEIEVLQQLRHPHIITFLEWGQDSYFFYLVTEAHGFNWEAFSVKDLATEDEEALDALDAVLDGTDADADETALDGQGEDEGEEQELDTADLDDATTTPPPGSESGQFAFQPGSFDFFSYLENCSGGKLSLPDARKVMRQLLSALHYLHGRSLIHGDLKEENILVGADLSIKLCDFGHAHDPTAGQGAGSGEGQATPTGDHTLYGTTEFSAPELLHHLGVCSPGVGEALLPPDLCHAHTSFPSDVWACGLLCYTMLAGALSEEHEELMLRGGIFSLPTYPLEALFSLLLLTPSEEGANTAIAAMEEQEREVEELMDFLSGMLAVSPTARRSVAELVEHPWLQRQP